MPGGRNQNPKKDVDLGEQFKLLSDKIDKLDRKQDEFNAKQDEFNALVREVKMLRQQNESQAKTIKNLEQRVDDLEAYSRRENVVISGLETKPKSYAKVVVDDTEQVGENAPQNELESLEDQVVNFLESKDISIDRNTIGACHLLGNRSRQHPRRIIIRFTNRKQKISLLKQGRKLSGTNVFLNEHLTQKNAQIARHARILRKKKEVKDTWTTNGLVFIRQKDDSVRRVSDAPDFTALGLPALMQDT